MIHNGNLEILGFLINPKINSLDGDDIPASSEDNKGLMVFNNDLNTVSIDTGEGYVSLLTDEASNETFITTLGENWINSNLSFNPTPFNDLDNVDGLTANSSLFDVITNLDSAISGVSINDINDIGNVDTSNKQNKYVLYFDDENLIAGSISDLAEDLSISFENLSNTEIGGLANNDYIIYDLDTQKYINKKKTFEYENLLGIGTHAVQHNLGERYCHVTVINRDTNTKVSSGSYTLEYVSVNELTVSLKENLPLTILVQIS